MKLAASLATALVLLAPPKLVNVEASEGGEFPAAIRVMPGTPPRVELTNTGNQPITAWSFTVSTPTATGVHRETHSADVYLSEVTGTLPGAEPHLDRVMPGQSRVLPIDASAPDASVQMTALVLQDGTALGDPSAITAWFDRRAKERDQLRAVAETFRSVLATKRGTAALTELVQQFRVGAGEDSTPRRTARDAVETLLRKAQAGNEEDADRSARAYAEFVGKQYDVAVRHADRKDGSQ
jgi:hypothetical protein